AERRRVVGRSESPVPHSGLEHLLRGAVPEAGHPAAGRGQYRPPLNPPGLPGCIFSGNYSHSRSSKLLLVIRYGGAMNRILAVAILVLGGLSLPGCVVTARPIAPVAYVEVSGHVHSDVC